MSEIRKFESGATRNDDSNKLNFEGFLHPLVLQRFGVYMHGHRYLEDGTLRRGDNWQSGIPKESAIDSGLRHVIDWWLEHRGYESDAGIEDALCGVLFNVQSYLLTVLQEKESYNEAVKATQELMNSVDPPKGIENSNVEEYSKIHNNNHDIHYIPSTSSSEPQVPQENKKELLNPIHGMLKKFGLKLKQ